MNKKMIILFITISLLVMEAFGNPSIKNIFTGHYDNSDTRLDNCAICMRSTSPPIDWNPYGTALINDPAYDRSDPVEALQNIEQLDSDGDGFTNIEEIQESTFPGDPDDFPAAQITPTSVLTAEPTDEQTPTSTVEQEPAAPFINTPVSLLVIVLAFILIRRKGKR